MKVYLTIPYIYEVQPTLKARTPYTNVHYVSLGSILFPSNHPENKIIFFHKNETTGEYYLATDPEDHKIKEKLNRYFKYTGNTYTLDLLLERIKLIPNDICTIILDK